MMTNLIHKLLLRMFGQEQMNEWNGRFNVHYFCTRSMWRSYWLTFFGK